ncbi:hypothetical protein SARC_08023 [Sphaeroforma arctica JP610]|uniref:Hydrophobin n=1 Tax=Sphaeroforma arctica JP610 TaxID=667725 RepID=A0A0L0FS74_9EUKA|nr:hypothetical protein SARC_08023 [Sphaeroforma arctica JP610]KNC79590.1 hypothetical protein SARC_08023 [Sphaeroforma arctica JP610]|eukprot:XP_014153492.1 hypothetical protein SARC_08023 [Sphaeroforma arctica JP610]
MFKPILATVVFVGQTSQFTNASAIPSQRRSVLGDIEGAIEGENGFDCASGVMAGITALTESDSYRSFTGDSFCDSAVYGLVVVGMELTAESDGSALESTECATTMGICCAADAGDVVLTTQVCQMLLSVKYRALTFDSGKKRNPRFRILK